MTTILIVDDLKTMRDQYAYDIHRKLGYTVQTASNGKEAIDIIEGEEIDAVVADIEMPVMDGLQFLEKLRERKLHEIPVIVYTAEGNFERCVRAVKLGAFNFFDKGEVSVDQLVRVVENAVEQRRLLRENTNLREQHGYHSVLIGGSPAMQSLKDQIARVAKVPSNTLILGESGTGKELVAREIYRLSERNEKPFIAVNCAALPEHLVESELFGFEKGAFTGAVRTMRGKFEAAHGGTLLLDEIGDMPLPVQAKLLRVLEEGEVTRLGGETRTIKIDVRVITATHKNLEDEIKQERFRRDLYYRICTHMLKVPPLRDRLDDVEALCRHFINRICKRFGIQTLSIQPDTVAALKSYDWKMNNVRELENTIERMIIRCDGKVLTPDHIPADIKDDNVPAMSTDGKSFSDLKKDAERRILLSALNENSWHITNTAKSLGIANHSNLLKMMRRHRIEKPKG